MNEAKWLNCSDPETMLEFLGSQISGRKLRLFACAFCRQIWQSPSVCELHRRGIEVAEEYTDGLVSDRDWSAIYYNLAAHMYGVEDHAEEYIAAQAIMAVTASYASAGFNRQIRQGAFNARRAAIRAFTRINEQPTSINEVDNELAREGAKQADMLRDLMGPSLFRPLSISLESLTWHDGTIPMIAQAIYADRRFADMPILADALEEAGCTDADILNHCRQPGEHVRGCWVVDLLLGKS